MDNDLPSPDQSEDEIEKSRESVRTKIERNKELLTIDLTYFLNKVIITLSNQERLNYLNYSPLAEKFTFDICEVVKKTATCTRGVGVCNETYYIHLWAYWKAYMSYLLGKRSCYK